VPGSDGDAVELSPAADIKKLAIHERETVQGSRAKLKGHLSEGHFLVAAGLNAGQLDQFVFGEPETHLQSQ
jgi:hypothetical protein